MQKADPRNILQSFTMLRFAVLFSLGIIIGDALQPAITLPTWLYTLLALLAVAVLCRRRYEDIGNIALMLIFICLGSLRLCFSSAPPTATDRNASNAARHHTMTCRMAVLSEPVRHGRVLRFDALACDGTAIGGTRFRVSLLCDSTESISHPIHLADGLQATAVLSSLETAADSTSHFDYARWLRCRGFSHMAFVPRDCWEHCDISKRDIGICEWTLLRLSHFRARLLQQLRATGISGDTFAVASAMALGDRTAVTQALREEYSMSGASHILALSGMHLTVVYFLLSLLFRRRRSDYNIIRLGIIWAYVVFTGMPISLVRAACMLTIYDATLILGRTTDRLNSIGLAATVLLIANPLSLWDIGFEMSFAAVVSITLFCGRLDALMPKRYTYCYNTDALHIQPSVIKRNRMVWLLWRMGSLSLAAQIGTVPLAAYYFGRVPLLSIVTSYVVVPCAFIVVAITLATCLVIAMQIGAEAITAAGGIISNILDALVWCGAQLLSGVTWLLNTVVSAVAHLPFACIDNVNITLPQMLLMYVIILSVSLLVRVKNEE